MPGTVINKTSTIKSTNLTPYTHNHIPTVVAEELTSSAIAQYKIMMKNHDIHKCYREMTNLEQCKLKCKSNLRYLNATYQTADKIQLKEKRGFGQDDCK
jgi:hypothetical protein